jgi:hypothetical protein
MKCADCKFFDRAGENAIADGQCRRRAPRDNDVGLAHWPYVEEHDWCGEFVHKQATEW